MKKRLISVVGGMLLLLSVFNFSLQANAAELTNLMQGKPVNLATSDTHYLGSTSAVTDNDPSTSVVFNVGVESSTVMDTLVMVFDQPVTVNKYKIQTDSNTQQKLLYYFYDANGAVIYSAYGSGNYTVPGDAGIYSLPKTMNGVKKAVIYNISNVKYNIAEWGLYYDDSPTNLIATAGNSEVNLSWDKVDNAESYVIHYGTQAGTYTRTATATKDEYGNFVIPGLSTGTTYYFVVSAVVGGVESNYSNEASATLQLPANPDPAPAPTGDRAILVITMINGLEKEYDLPMSDVTKFLNWYDAKDAGTGPSKYAISKYSNNKGPFASRTDYVIFNNILTFEVNAYNE